MDFLVLFEECVIKHFDRIQPDRILNMQVMFGHIHIGMANQTLDCSEINTQRLHLRYISMTTAVRSQGPKAFDRFPSVEGLIIHSDQGWQYQHATYRNELRKHGVVQSMSRKGNCYDNCIMETFFGRLKNEMFYGFEKEYTSFESFSRAIDEYIDYYNNRRIQAKTKWMPPSKFREASMMKS